MLEKFRQTIYQDFPDFNDRQIFVAISGGKDSICLSKLLIDLKISHTLLHCNFQLRGNESEMDEKFLVDYAERNNLTLNVKCFNTKLEAKKAKTNTQLTARNLRYNWFKEFSEENSLILTAHHRDDSIETFFLNLLRGTGLKGATGIPKIHSHFYRPLLVFDQEEIENYLLQTKTDFRNDSSNKELKYRRNIIRHQLIPQFESLEPAFKKKISSYLEENEEVQDYIDNKTSEVFSPNIVEHDNYIQIPLSILESTDDVLSKNFFAKFNVNRGKFNEFISFLSSNTGAKFQTNSHDFIIDRGFLLIQKSTLVLNNKELLISSLPWFSNNSIKLQITSQQNIDLNSNNIDFLDFDKLRLPLRLRPWKKGDKIRPLGMVNYKLVSDILINKKVNQFDKNQILVLENSDSEIISIIGKCISDKYKVQDQTEMVLAIHY